MLRVPLVTDQLALPSRFRVSVEAAAGCREAGVYSLPVRGSTLCCAGAKASPVRVTVGCSSKVSAAAGRWWADARVSTWTLLARMGVLPARTFWADSAIG